jgi:hypothetical protein
MKDFLDGTFEKTNMAEAEACRISNMLLCVVIANRCLLR